MRLAIVLFLAALALVATPRVIHAIGTRHRSPTWCRVWHRATDMHFAGECVRYSWDAAAIGHLRRMQTAEALYQAKFGGYATDEDALVDARLLDPLGGERSGYGFSVTATASGFGATALPRCPVCTSRAWDRTFFTDETGVIRFATTGVAGPGSLPIGG